MLSRMASGRDSFMMLVAVLASISSGTPLAAQDVVGAKIGVFNADRVLAESRPGQQALALFSQLREQRIGELQLQQDDLNLLQRQVVTAVPGSPEGARLQRQLEDKMLGMERLQQDVQQELGERQNELTVDIMQMVAQIIDEMGEEEGYTLIFNQIQSGLVYIGPTIDITDEIIQRVNDMSPADPA